VNQLQFKKVHHGKYHYYTRDPGTGEEYGWRTNHIAFFYGFTKQVPGTVPVYRETNGTLTRLTKITLQGIVPYPFD